MNRTLFNLLSLSTVVLALHAVAESPASRYRDHADGTVTDVETGLMWMKCSIGQEWTPDGCTGEATVLMWDEAVQAAKGVSFAGHDDWRLPTSEELNSLVYCSSGSQQGMAKGVGGWCLGSYHKPTIDPAAFPNTPPRFYWSSKAYNRGHAWGVAFDSGCSEWVLKGMHGRARLVRKGP